MGFITDNITASTITITSGATDGYVLKSNSYGDATWQLPVITDNLTIQGDGTTNNPLSTVTTAAEQVVLFADLATTEPLKPCTYDNGMLGAGATLTGNANGQLSTISFSGKVDNTTTAVGQIILVRAQSTINQPQNGLYVVTQLGDATMPFILTRTTDSDTQDKLYPLQINVFSGSTQANLAYLQKTADPIVGTSNIQFTTTQIGIQNTPVFHLDTVTSTPLPTCTYTSGTNPSLPGSGAYLEATVVGPLGTINGIVMSLNRRILVKDEVNGAHNGTYIVAGAGSASTKWKLVRLDAWGGNFINIAREWKVNNPASTKYGARYSTNLGSLSNTQVGVAPITFFEAPAGVKYSNVLFVDPINGVDATAAANLFTNPYLTIGAAITAATGLTPTTTNRTLIYVRRGEYPIETIINLQNNTDFYFEPGVVVNAKITDNGVDVSSNIYGKAILSSSGLAINLSSSVTKCNFEFDEISSLGAAFYVLNASLTLSCRKITAQGIGNAYGCSPRGSGNVTVNVIESFSCPYNVFAIRQFSGKLQVTCPKIIVTDGTFYNGDSKSAISCLDNLGGEAIFNANIYNQVAVYPGVTSAMIRCWTNANLILRFNGDIYADNNLVIYAGAQFSTSRTIINGNVSSNLQIGYISIPTSGPYSFPGGESQVIFRNGTILNNNTYTGYTTAPLFELGRSSTLYIQNCEMYAAGSGTNCVNKLTTTSALNIHNSLYFARDAVGELVSSTVAADPVRLHNVRSTKPISANTVDQLTPTGLIVDTQTITPNFI